MKEEEVQTEELTLFPWRVTTAQVSHIYFVSADRIEKYKLTPTITITFFFFFTGVHSQRIFTLVPAQDEKRQNGEVQPWTGKCLELFFSFITRHIQSQHQHACCQWAGPTVVTVMVDATPLLVGGQGSCCVQTEEPLFRKLNSFCFCFFCFFSSKDQNISQVHSKDDRFSGVLRRQHASLDLRQHDVVSERFSKI